MAALDDASDAPRPSACDGDIKQTTAAQPPPPPPPCSTCGASSKYKCPGCGARSCSAPCVKLHKAEARCSGKRDRVAFLSVSEMSGATLASDVSLLEEVERAASAAARGVSLPVELAEAVAKASRAAGGGRFSKKDKKSHHHQHHHHQHHPSSSSKSSPALPPHLQQLVAEASRRGVRLRLAPPGFEARKSNTGTRYDGKSKKMLWQVEWRFLKNGDDEASSSTSLFVTREDKRVREDVPLGPVLRRHLGGSGGGGEKGGGEKEQQLPRAFVDAVATSSSSNPAPPPPLPLRAFLRLDGRPANAPAWLEFSSTTMRSSSSCEGEGGGERERATSSSTLSFLFDETATLSELLRGRTVDEHPVVALVVSTSTSIADANGLQQLPRGEIVAFARPPPAVAAAPAPPVSATPPPSSDVEAQTNATDV